MGWYDIALFSHFLGQILHYWDCVFGLVYHSYVSKSGNPFLDTMARISPKEWVIWMHYWGCAILSLMPTSSSNLCSVFSFSRSNLSIFSVDYGFWDICKSLDDQRLGILSRIGWRGVYMFMGFLRYWIVSTNNWLVQTLPQQGLVS